MQRQRVVAVITTTSVAASGRGSGYVVGPRLVLTSAHVTGPTGSPVEVFRPGHPQTYLGRVVWSGTPGGRDDAALVVIDDPAWRPPSGRAVRWGRTLTYRPGIPCESWGLPALVQREGRPAELLQPSGTLNPGDRYVGDRYVMAVTGTAPGTPADKSSPWAGMSGAALFCGDLLAGVVAADPAGRGHGHLEAVPAYVLHHDPAFRAVLGEHSAIEEREGVVLEPIEFQHLAEAADPAAVVVPGGIGVSPAGLLRARRQIVPFHGRQDVLARLNAWADLPGFGALLLHGVGGQGKTRLATHLAGQLAAAGWGTLWLRPNASPADLAVIADTAAGLLVVIDYAESRTDQVTALLEAATRLESPCPLKVLLVARTAGSWWHSLKRASSTNGALLEHAPLIDLQALEQDPAERGHAYRQAALAFAHALEQSPALAEDSSPAGSAGESWSALAAALPLPAALGTAQRGNALTLHMSALTDLLDAATGATAVGGGHEMGPAGAGVGAAGVEDRLLEHEERYWRSAAVVFGLYDRTRDGLVLPQVLTDALAAAIALGAADHSQALALLARLPALAERSTAERRERVRDWLAALYPPTDPHQPWGTLQPDLVAERFIGRHLLARPGLADQLTVGADTVQAVQLLTIYTRAAGHRVFAGSLDAALTALCARQAAVLVPAAIEVAPQAERPAPLLDALQQVLNVPDLPHAAMRAWHDHLPQHSQVLAGWAVHLTAHLATWHRDHQDLPNLAVSLNNLSVRLGGLGRREEGLAAIEEAVAIRRELARTHPDAYLPDLAMSLNNLSVDLGDLGRREEGLAAIEEATTSYRKLARTHPDAYLPNLATSLNNLSIRLGDVGRREEALTAIEEATTILRKLARTHPDAYLPDLAMSLNNLSIRLGGVGRREEALTAIEEATAIRQGLAKARPAVYQAELEQSLAVMEWLRGT
ncbi:tetratricopeptide repeat protein [Streptosporangium sp. NPDC001559]|uniref:tetratricopeptide repeat protein n=1 Tax=Streptosporangium sp. NPDC001559 TaxID=3366187 RepID=UPI0036EFA7EB